MQVTTAPLNTVTPGELLAGKYRVERVLGEGGMGIVVAAIHEALRQRVAIKLLRPGALESTEALGRFEREARAAASLRSEHVARVLDIGKLEDGRPYMVMEYLEGIDLGEMIDSGRKLAPWEAVDFVLQACEAIAEAHGNRIVHRDLKPRNLFLAQTVDGRPLVKVLDFGISKVAGGVEDMQLTRTTEVIGSPSYMSPEQLRSSKLVDLRTDIWALGVILYELLTGRLPFYANTVTELVAIVLMDQEPTLRSVREDIPDGLAAIVSRCLAKQPDARFQTVGELAYALAPFGSASVATAADRVVAVARGSGNALPDSSQSTARRLPQAPASTAHSVSGSGPVGTSSAPLVVSSARLNVHGGTSVAWGETQVEGAGRSRSRTFLLAGAGLLAAFAIFAGVFFFVQRRHDASGGSTQPAAANSLPLPPGRKDLPPLENTAPPPASAAVATVAEPLAPPIDPPAAVPSALPSTRHPIAVAKPPAPPPRPPTPPPPAPATQKAPDDLSNIGRR